MAWSMHASSSYVKDANYVVELFNKDDVGLVRDRLFNMPVV